MDRGGFSLVDNQTLIEYNVSCSPWQQPMHYMRSDDRLKVVTWEPSHVGSGNRMEFPNWPSNREADKESLRRP